MSAGLGDGGDVDRLPAHEHRVTAGREPPDAREVVRPPVGRHEVGERHAEGLRRGYPNTRSAAGFHSTIVSLLRSAATIASVVRKKSRPMPKRSGSWLSSRRSAPTASTLGAPSPEPWPPGDPALCGGRDRRRSGDLPLFRRTLCQLSYPTEISRSWCLAVPTGFEPATSGVTGRRALQTAPRDHGD